MIMQVIKESDFRIAVDGAEVGASDRSIAVARYSFIEWRG